MCTNNVFYFRAPSLEYHSISCAHACLPACLPACLFSFYFECTTFHCHCHCHCYSYAFDRVFDASESQVNVFDATAKFLIPSVLEGFNATVFAYGQVRMAALHGIQDKNISCRKIGLYQFALLSFIFFKLFFLLQTL